MGRPRKPAAILALHGSPKAKQRASEEPKVAPGRPEKPEWLSGEAAEAWAQVVPQLEHMGTLAAADVRAIARYCMTWAVWVKAAQAVTENGFTETRTNSRGKTSTQVAAELRAMDTAERILVKLEQQFGLTPSARANLKVERRSAEGESPFARRAGNS